MTLKKVIRSFIIFLLCSSGCYLLLIYLLLICKNNSQPLIYSVSDVIVRKGGNTFKKFSDFDANKIYDVLVIGSSHAYRGYDPEIFRKSGVELFNLGTSGQTPLNSYYLAVDYIKPGHCKLVILDIYDEALRSDGVESTADLMQNIPSSVTVLKMGLALKDPRMLNMLAVRLFKLKEEPEYTDNAYTINGYSKTTDSLKHVNKLVYQSKGELNQEQMNYLEKTIGYLLNQKIKVILVTHPAPVEWGIGKHMEVRNHILALAIKYRVQYMDYFSYPGFSSENDFYDTHHLNQTGVQKFNKILIQDLKRYTLSGNRPFL